MNDNLVLLTHGKVKLALHELRGGEGGGRPLLMLHGLGESARVPDRTDLVAGWRGPVYALDFTGHGESTIPRGGGYTPEMLMADADVAIAHLGPSTLVGFGLGGYAGLLLAGGRPREVRGVAVCDGPGLDGGGALPGRPTVNVAPTDAAPGPPDPLAIVELRGDLRPPDYVTVFARAAESRSGLAHPIIVCAVERPAWLVELLAEPGVAEGTLAGALATYSSAR